MTMHNHLHGIHYLREFQDPDVPEHVWVFDKKAGLWSEKPLPIEAVGQSKGYLEDDDERWLSEHVEGPAIRLLSALRDGEPLEMADREHMALYLEMMLRRSYWYRQKLVDGWPRVLAEYWANMNENPERWAEEHQLTVGHVPEANRYLETLQKERVSLKYRLFRPIHSNPELLKLIFLMTWRIVRTDKANPFVTSDTPLYFHKGIGFIPPDGEFSVPLASHAALHGSWQPSKNGLLESVELWPTLNREINRRTVTGAERFVYACNRLPWVKKYLTTLGRSCYV